MTTHRPFYESLNNSIKKGTVVYLDGSSLNVETLLSLAAQKLDPTKPEFTIDLTAEAWANVRRSRSVVDKIIKENRVVYGITTGFGNFSNVVIPLDKIEELQYNLITSHCAGVGEPLAAERVLALLILRLNTLAKGYSGIRSETLQAMLAFFNAGCVAFIPQQGSVGASGDLAPLSHLALALLGQGRIWSREAKDWRPAAEVLAALKLTPIRLAAKEGLSLINGTQLISCLAAEAVARASRLVKIADIITALTLDALRGTVRAYSANIHATRPHAGQSECARRLRTLLNFDGGHTEISNSHINCGKVQDSYSLRCVPQVHGVVADTLAFVRGVIETEMNSATDNPMVFASGNDDGEGDIISGGNFHGEYPAKAVDYLTIAVHELANISERRIERLVNSTHSELPAFLTPHGGLHSGFMIAHVTAAALVSENKVLCHPASTDSIPTSANKEDHVSMGPWAARKCLQVISNVENVLAVELLCNCQGIEFLRPLKTSVPLELVHAELRKVVQPWTGDRYMAADIEAACKLIQSGRLIELVEPYWTTNSPIVQSAPHSHSHSHDDDDGQHHRLDKKLVSARH